MAHIIYIPLTIAVGIFIGYQLGLQAAEEKRRKQKRIDEARKKRIESRSEEDTADQPGRPSARGRDKIGA